MVKANRRERGAAAVLGGGDEFRERHPGKGRDRSCRWDSRTRRREPFFAPRPVPPNFLSRFPKIKCHTWANSRTDSRIRARRPRILPGDAENLVEKKCVLVLVRSPLRDVTRGYVARGAMRSVAPAQRADVAAARVSRVDAAALGRRRFPERSRDASRKRRLGERVPSEASARRARRAEGARVPARHATRARAPRSAPRRDFRSEVRLASRRRRAVRVAEVAAATKTPRAASAAPSAGVTVTLGGWPLVATLGLVAVARLDVRHRARFGRGARAAAVVRASEAAERAAQGAERAMAEFETLSANTLVDLPAHADAKLETAGREWDARARELRELLTRVERWGQFSGADEALTKLTSAVLEEPPARWRRRWMRRRAHQEPHGRLLGGGVPARGLGEPSERDGEPSRVQGDVGKGFIKRGEERRPRGRDARRRRREAEESRRRRHRRRRGGDGARARAAVSRC